MIRKLRAEGVKWEDVGERLGMTRLAVYRRARDLGLPSRVYKWNNPPPLSARQERAIRELRADRATWRFIALALGMNANTLDFHRRELGLERDNVGHDVRVPWRQRPPSDARAPLPPGHEITWHALVAGTCLAGTPYPTPEPFR